ncbi:putative NBD/HSP70 family sugar kinase [Terracoccus luteus]|nr:putative NBD/HSP70 family sugar kinase [Terracoccus luteus]
MPGGRSGVRQASLRSQNLALVLGEIYEATRPTTRARVAAALDITRATASDLVERLVDADLVDELAPEAATTPGRPGVVVAPSSDGVAALGLEIQVDHLTAQVLALDGTVLGRAQAPGDHRDSDPRRVTRELARLAGRALETLPTRTRLLGACVSVPALLRSGGSVVQLAPNLGWTDVDLAALLDRQAPLTGIRVEVGNDADLSALAETRARSRADGSPRGEQSFLYLAGEVGIGGAVVIGGETTRGRHGWSGEIGHVVVDRSGPRCACGATGCLEQYAGLDVIRRRAGLGLGATPADLLTRVPRGVRAGRALGWAAEAIGVAVASTLNIVDVDRVVLGGVYAELFDHLAAGIEAEVAQRVLAARWAPVAVERAVAGPGSAVTGAALRVLERVVADPASFIEAGA